MMQTAIEQAAEIRRLKKEINQLKMDYEMLNVSFKSACIQISHIEQGAASIEYADKVRIRLINDAKDYLIKRYKETSKNEN